MLGDLDFVVVFYDSIFIFSETIEEPFQHESLAHYEFQLNHDKSQLFYREVTFLGFKISENDIDIDPEKIKSVIEFSVSSKTDQLLLRFTGSVRRFTAYYATIAGPLYEFLKKRCRFFMN